MIFRFRNIGPIKAADLELGRITIIAGRNNTGKTYLAYTLYGFLKQWMGWPEIPAALAAPPGPAPADGPAPAEGPAPADGHDAPEPLDLAALTGTLSRDGYATRRVDPITLSRERAAIAGRLTADFSETQLSRVLSASSTDFQGAHLSVEWPAPLPGSIPSQNTDLSDKRTLSVGYDDGHIWARVTGRGRKSPNPGPTFEPVVAGAYLQLLLSDFPDPFILTAERFGISLFHRELDFTKNQLVELLQQLREGNRADRRSPFWIIDRTMSRYASPIKDNIDYTRSLPDVRKEASEVRESKLHDEIKAMMDGYYRLAGGDVHFISRRRKDKHFDVPLYRASSSARGLSDFYFYLRHVAQHQQLLIIDEPESHLDTENQVQLARLLAKISNLGIRVLITTHSDYIVKEINNLLMLGRLTNRDAAVERYGYRRDSALRTEDVCAYVARDGGLDRCDANDYGLDYPVFEATIDSINERSQRIAGWVMEQEEGVE